ncbi:MAG TPA: EAL domain-containing protein [Stellaceae bacterium]|nr:EAL domain-containing protein [Stellaceae bacterium]
MPTMTASAQLEAVASDPDRIASFLSDLPIAAALFDRDLRYVVANSAWLAAFGLSADMPASLRHHQADLAGAAALDDLQQRTLAGETVEYSGDDDPTNGFLRARVLRASPWHGADDDILGIVATVEECSPPLAHDPDPDSLDGLTGLPGRDAFIAQIRAALAASEGARRGAAMFVVNLDNFRGINGLYGVRAGDYVLKAVAKRIRAGVRSRLLSGRPSRAEGDYVARLGADEFGILIGDPAPSASAAESFARRILKLVEEPIVASDQRIRLTASVGFLITGAPHKSEDEVLRDLHASLQEAKSRGPNNIQAWRPALTRTSGHRFVLLDQLRRALDEGEFAIHYQPILRLGDSRIVGAEALLRWNHPSDGLTSPSAFLPILEDSNLIVPVGCWVIREVVRQMRVWQMLYGRDIIEWVSVNVSPRQFNDPGLLLATLTEIERSGFALDRLKIEITESAAMRNPEMTRSVLDELRELGVRVAIDDFGTGYSALGALRHYAVDTIKIDRGFTSRLETDDGGELVMALLRIAQAYGAEVVAEGIETMAQRDILEARGCGFGQGYLFAKPMDGSFFGAYALTHLVQNGGAP